MLSLLRGPLTAGLIAIFMLSLIADAAPASAVRVVRGTDLTAETVTLAPTAAEQALMRDKYWRVRTFAPYFDSRLNWAPGAWVQQHAYGLDAAEVAAHPGWQLVDGSNTPLYIGTRAAADPGNAAFRAWWIAKARAAVAAGYSGLFIDDVFMERRTTTSGGVSRIAIDPRTGLAFTEANWQRHMADFMVAVRAAFPTLEIVHDVLWYKGDANADVLRALQAATVLSVDGGFTTNVTSGGGTYGFQTLAGWVEREQTRGGAVVLDYSTTAPATRLYGLASLLVVTNRLSAIANDASTAPAAYWSGFDADVGWARGPRYPVANGAWRRDYTSGIVFVNEPFRTTRTFTVPAGYQDLDGVTRTSVTLAGGQGAVLVAIPPAPTPTPPPPPVATPAPTPSADAPVATAPPVAPTRTTTTTRSRGGATARISTAGHTAGARAPGDTALRVSGSRSRLSGKVTGAVAGYVRLTVELKRGGKWVVARRAKVAVKRNGRFVKDIPSLPGGTYRVRGFFEGTGTSQPARSSNRTFRA